MQDLVILTGHSSGLGLALLDGLLQRQVAVIGIARRSSGRVHANLIEINWDLSTPVGGLIKQLQAVLDARLTSIRSLSFINNAGSAGPIAIVGQLDNDAIAASLALNLTAPLQLLNFLFGYLSHFAMRMVQISSGAAKKSYPGWLVYCSSKAALRMSAEVIAKECRETGADLRVLIYEPGVLDSPMQSELRAMTQERFPEVERFQLLFKNRQLVTTVDSARELLDLWQDPAMPALMEKRFGVDREK